MSDQNLERLQAWRDALLALALSFREPGETLEESVTALDKERKSVV